MLSYMERVSYPPEYDEPEMDAMQADFERACRWLGGYGLDMYRDEDGEAVYADSNTQRAWMMWCLCAGGLENSDCP